MSEQMKTNVVITVAQTVTDTFGSQLLSKTFEFCLMLRCNKQTVIYASIQSLINIGRKIKSKGPVTSPASSNPVPHWRLYFLMGILFPFPLRLSLATYDMIWYDIMVMTRPDLTWHMTWDDTWHLMTINTWMLAYKFTL